MNARPRDNGLHVLGLTVAVSALLALLAGCGGGSSGGGNPVSPGGGTGTGTGSSSLTGVFASGGDGGKLALTIGTAAANLSGSLAGVVVTVTGVLTPTNASPIALQGVYDTTADTLRVVGSGYAFVGTYDTTGVHPRIVGTYQGHQGNGVFACFLATGSPIRAFVGNYLNDAFTSGGTWNMVAVDTVIVGATVPGGGTEAEIIGFEGTVARSGTLRPIFVSGTSGNVTLYAGGTWDTASDSASGTWQTAAPSIPASDHGTWMTFRVP